MSVNRAVDRRAAALDRMRPEERHRRNLLETRRHVLSSRRRAREVVRPFLSLAAAKRIWLHGMMTRADIARDVRRQLYDRPARVWLRAAGVMRPRTRPPARPPVEDAYALGPLMSFTFRRVRGPVTVQFSTTPMRKRGTP